MTDKKKTKKDKSEGGFANLVDSNLDTVVLHTFGSVFPGFVLLLIYVTKRGNRSKHKVRPSTNNHPLIVQDLIYHLKEFVVRVEQIQNFSPSRNDR